jgi:hypothetical protein
VPRARDGVYSPEEELSTASRWRSTSPRVPLPCTARRGGSGPRRPLPSRSSRSPRRSRRPEVDAWSNWRSRRVGQGAQGLLEHGQAPRTTAVPNEGLERRHGRLGVVDEVHEDARPRRGPPAPPRARRLADDAQVHVRGLGQAHEVAPPGPPTRCGGPSGRRRRGARRPGRAASGGLSQGSQCEDARDLSRGAAPQVAPPVIAADRHGVNARAGSRSGPRGACVPDRRRSRCRHGPARWKSASGEPRSGISATAIVWAARAIRGSSREVWWRRRRRRARGQAAAS